MITNKNHFISGLSTADPDLPIRKWDRLLHQCLITLNLLRSYMVNPYLSACAYIFGPYDFNKSPMAPHGTRVILHNKPGNGTIWGHHGTPGWYIGPSLDRYRCMQGYMPVTGIVRITYTLQYILKVFDIPTTTTENYLQQAIGDIIEIMKHPRRHFFSCIMVIQEKMRSLRFPKSCKEAHLSHAYKFYHYHHCYHKLRVNIFNFKFPQHTSNSSEGGTGFATSGSENASVRTHTTYKRAYLNIPQIGSTSKSMD